MRDIYNIEKAQEKKKEETRQDNSLLQEAQKIEEENYEQAKDIRMKITKAAVDQRNATEEMKRQTETLQSAKKTAVGVHEEARKGEELADEIDREGHIFSCRCTFLEKLFKWFKRDNGDKEVQEINEKDESEIKEPSYTHEEFKEGDEFVPGQNKTDKELYGVLNAVRRIKQQAEVQSMEAGRQKTAIKDIGKINEHSKKVIKRTDEHLKKID